MSATAVNSIRAWLAANPTGVLVVTGGTGSGKSRAVAEATSGYDDVAVIEDAGDVERAVTRSSAARVIVVAHATDCDGDRLTVISA